MMNVVPRPDLAKFDDSWVAPSQTAGGRTPGRPRFVGIRQYIGHNTSWTYGRENPTAKMVHNDFSAPAGKTRPVVSGPPVTPMMGRARVHGTPLAGPWFGGGRYNWGPDDPTHQAAVRRSGTKTCGVAGYGFADDSRRKQVTAENGGDRAKPRFLKGTWRRVGRRGGRV